MPVCFHHPIRSLFCLALLLFAPVRESAAQSAPPPAVADTTRSVLLVFSGSDWCLPCIQLEKKILADSAFVQFAAENLTLVKADFPQRKKLTREQVLENEALAARYNPEGAFPKLLLLYPDRAPRATLKWSGLDATAFVDQIKRLLSPK